MREIPVVQPEITHLCPECGDGYRYAFPEHEVAGMRMRYVHEHPTRSCLREKIPAVTIAALNDLLDETPGIGDS